MKCGTIGSLVTSLNHMCASHFITYSMIVCETFKHEPCSLSENTDDQLEGEVTREFGIVNKREAGTAGTRGSSACVLSSRRLTSTQRSPPRAGDKHTAIWMTSCDDGLDCGICQRDDLPFPSPLAHTSPFTRPYPKTPPVTANWITRFGYRRDLPPGQCHPHKQPCCLPACSTPPPTRLVGVALILAVALWWPHIGNFISESFSARLFTRKDSNFLPISPSHTKVNLVSSASKKKTEKKKLWGKKNKPQQKKNTPAYSL